MEEFQLLAYHKWCIRQSGKDRKTLAGILFADIVQDQNPLVFDLLEMTGDEDYTQESFYKAADILLKADQR
jgi:hypothetical protein